MPRADDSAGLPSLAEAEWLRRPETRAVFDALRAGGAEVRAVGGVVRNALMGVPVKDVDIATTAAPKEVARLAARAGLHSVPTGIDHGTVTVVADGRGFEVTTLRRDVETDGRHAVVAFSDDLDGDARRRDFTMNALYADRHGMVIDPIAGLDDLRARRLRFVGNPARRIA
jgi:poly(A) polymerase